jgi:hypothetical protein
MDEAAWLVCSNPKQMLQHLCAEQMERKSLLFICTCFRRIWELLPEAGHDWTELAEEVAEGRADFERLSGDAEYDALGDAWERASGAQKVIVQAVADVYYYNLDDTGMNSSGPAWEDERRAQATLVREIFGNPFRPSTADPSWCKWNGGVVQGLVQSIYEQRSFDQMPILADALEDAGCTDPAILAHCRQPGEHVRGCWVVDLLLGKS